MSSFDAEALERAAKAARELEKSRHAAQAIEMSRREQDVRRAEATRETERAKAQAESFKVEGEKVRWEEQRKTIKFNKEQQVEVERTRLAMEREKLKDEDRLARQRNEEMVQMQNRAAAERERMRRQTEMEIQEERRRTDERRAVLERENMRARALAEAEGRIQEQRKNEDIYARQIKLRGEETRKQITDAIETTFSSLRTAGSAFISDGEAVTTTVIGLTALAAGVYGTREGARVVGRYVESVLGKPSLVRETSRTSGHFAVRRRLGRAMGLAPPEEKGLKGVVLDAATGGRVKDLAEATANTKRNAAPFRHMLFYGPPGTGKTMVAKRLARSSGMDYAIMTGGDVGPLGRDAVTEIHKLFDWGARSRRGLLLFIDEADAFLVSRSSSRMSEEQRNALNAVLYRTGEASRDIMLVLASNRPGDLDAAVLDRVDEAMLFDLPDVASRESLHKLYFHTYVTEAGKAPPAKGLFATAVASISASLRRGQSRIRVGEGFDDDFFASLARRTEGWSGRAISKLYLSVQGTVYGRHSPELTLELFEEVLAYKEAEYQERALFATSQDTFQGKSAGADADGVYRSRKQPETATETGAKAIPPP